MRRLLFREIMMITALLLITIPAIIPAQPEQAKPGAPPVVQPLVSEGEFAVSLGSALGLVTTEDEVEAESRLGESGIAPRNGWIADYPVTPDIFMELQKAVGDAADAGKISVSKGEALKRLSDVSNEFGLPVRPYTAEATYEPTAVSCQNYPNPVAINTTYTSEGPPVVTYYCPPPDYYYMYSWVPAPFWWSDLWFPGFFILNDFHRVIHHHRRVFVITNHFNDLRSHRVFRIDPRERFRGRTFGGIGVSRPRDFMQTGVPRSERTIFNGPRMQRLPGGETVAPAFRGGQRVIPVPRGGERTAPPMEGGRISPPSGGRGPIERGERR